MARRSWSAVAIAHHQRLHGIEPKAQASRLAAAGTLCSSRQVGKARRGRSKDDRETEQHRQQRRPRVRDDPLEYRQPGRIADIHLKTQTQPISVASAIVDKRDEPGDRAPSQVEHPAERDEPGQPAPQGAAMLASGAPPAAGKVATGTRRPKHPAIATKNTIASTRSLGIALGSRPRSAPGKRRSRPRPSNGG